MTIYHFLSITFNFIGFIVIFLFVLEWRGLVGRRKEDKVRAEKISKQLSAYSREYEKHRENTSRAIDFEFEILKKKKLEVLTEEFKQYLEANHTEFLNNFISDKIDRRLSRLEYIIDCLYSHWQFPTRQNQSISL